LKKLSFRSYKIQTDKNTIIVRNRRFIKLFRKFENVRNKNRQNEYKCLRENYDNENSSQMTYFAKSERQILDKNNDDFVNVRDVNVNVNVNESSREEMTDDDDNSIVNMENDGILNDSSNSIVNVKNDGILNDSSDDSMKSTLDENDFDTRSNINDSSNFKSNKVIRETVRSPSTSANDDKNHYTTRVGRITKKPKYLTEDYVLTDSDSK